MKRKSPPSSRSSHPASPARPAAANPPPPGPGDWRRLEQTLDEAINAQKKLVELLHEKQQRIRDSDPAALPDLLRRENEALQAFSEIEKRRLHQAADLTQRIDPDARAPMTLEQLAWHAPAGTAEKLRERRALLRENASQLQRSAGASQRACRSLAACMQSVLQQVMRSVQGATYQRGPRKAAAMSTFATTA